MILLVAGQVASGKSTYARELSSRLSWPVFAFGSYVAECAARIGLDPTDRSSLQDVGYCLAKRPDRFCRSFLDWTTRPSNFIVDGLRHMGILEELRRQVGSTNLALVFVDTPEDVAQARHLDRSRDVGELEAVRAHVVEAGITALRTEARWIVDGLNGNGLDDIEREFALG